MKVICIYHRYLLLILPFLICFFSSLAVGYWAPNGVWTPDDTICIKFDPSDDKRIIINKVLIDHKKWLENDSEGSKAELCNVDLRGMTNIFEKRNLERANLRYAKLIGLNLTNTNLREADLQDANLTGAILINTELEGANFRNAIVDNVRYEPVSLPNVRNFGSIKGLKTLSSGKNQYSGLSELRTELKVAGLRELEREVTYAYEHTVANDSNDIIKLLKRFAFEYTTGYGLNPHYALYILGIFFCLFTVFYTIVIFLNGKDGIWQEWNKDRCRDYLGSSSENRILLQFSDRRAFLFGLQFSVISALRIGWRDINFGGWVQQLKPREYILRATGWTRFFSGIQSLLSVYFIAMWFLTTFTRPFE